nr:hypothetical protein [Corynebacterium auriscanis]
MMRIRNQRLRARVRNTPQRGQRLWHRKGQVVAGYRPPGAALGLLGFDGRDLLCARHRAEFRVKAGDALVDALLDARVLPVRLAQGLARDRVAAHPDQELELRLGDLPTLSELTAAEKRQPRPHPETRRSSFLRVVPRQRGRKGAVAITGGDGAQQILVAVAGRHHAHRDRHTDEVSRQHLVAAAQSLLVMST